jgi:hypothetical protein
MTEIPRPRRAAGSSDPPDPIRIVAASRIEEPCIWCGAAIVLARVATAPGWIAFDVPIVFAGTVDGSGVVQVDMFRTTSHATTCPKLPRRGPR